MRYLITIIICIFTLTSYAGNETKLVGKQLVVEQKSKVEAVDTGYTIKVNNKVYKLMRGPRGGIYYMKDGKKVYLSKKQKALIK